MADVTKPRRRPAILNPNTGETGHFDRVQGRHVFVPSGEEAPEAIGEKELERWEHPSPAFNRSEKNTYGYGRPDDGADPRPDETYRGTRGDAIESETYIVSSTKVDMDKLSETKLGDSIKYYINGNQDEGIVVSITGEYVKLLKASGLYEDIHINDTFQVSEIVKGKPWNKLTIEEKSEALTKARCPLSYITRNWYEIPEEARKVITAKSDVEDGNYGGVPTSTFFDAENDYEGESHRMIDNEFQHVTDKPQTSNTGHKKKVDTQLDRGQIAGVSDKAEEEEDKEKEAYSTSDSGSFNAVHNVPPKGNPEDDKKKYYGVPESSGNDYWFRQTKA